jgi:hypothetical protein
MFYLRNRTFEGSLVNLRSCCVQCERLRQMRWIIAPAFTKSMFYWREKLHKEPSQNRG